MICYVKWIALGDYLIGKAFLKVFCVIRLVFKNWAQVLFIWRNIK